MRDEYAIKELNPRKNPYMGQQQGTYREEFPKWLKKVHREHGYDSESAYSSETEEKLYNEALQTYTSPAPTAEDYFVSAESNKDEFLAFFLKRIHEEGIQINKLSNKEHWALNDRLVAEFRAVKGNEP